MSGSATTASVTGSVAPGIRTHFATTIRNDHLLQATSGGG